MSIFNQSSRTRNALQSSLVSVVCRTAHTLLGFAYRSIFIHVLSSSHLGINGLFENILSILSITELGFSTAIAYRFYEPISKEDVAQVGRLVNFYKQIYFIIGSFIFLLGMSLVPFLDIFLKDIEEVPKDINLRFIYILFLMQSLATYLFAYRQAILVADQKQYIVSLVNTAVTFLRYVLQVILLLAWKNYTLTLIAGVILTVGSNYLISIWVTHKYRAVFEIRERLPKEERKEIYRDTKATLLHKIGGTVLTATDNLVLSKFIGLVATGIYSNYSLIISSLAGILDQLLTSFTSSIGNAHVETSSEKRYVIYQRLQFLNLWLSGMFCTCLFALTNDFISLWVGEEMMLSTETVIVLCIQFYLQGGRKISMTYTSACGLFTKDRVRPLIEAGLNLAVSIILAMRCGIIGVFIGTIVSCVLTVFWREPYILYKYEFHRPVSEYWKTYMTFALFTAAINVLLYAIQNNIPEMPRNFLSWIACGVICVFIFNVAAIAAFGRREEFCFYRELFKVKCIRGK